MFRKILTIQFLKAKRTIYNGNDFVSISFCTLVSVLLFSLVFQSCSKDDNPLDKLAEQTILVYLAGDSNLTNEPAQKMNAIAEGFDGKQNNRIIVYKDDWNTPVLLEIKKDKSEEIYYDTIAAYQEENSASKEIFERAVKLMQEKAPAKKYGLIVFSHGWGWLPPKAQYNPNGQNFRSILNDNNEELSILDFASAIPNNLFNYIILEACYMGGVEVAYELRNKTDYIMFSPAEIWSPGLTYVYSKVIGYLLKSTPDFTQIAKDWFNYFVDNPATSASPWSTVSLIKTEGLEELAMTVKKVGGIPAWSQELANVQSYSRPTNSSPYHFFFDFGDVYKHTLTGEEYTQIEDMLNNILLYFNTTEKLYSSILINTSSGLSTHIKGRYPSLDAYYETLEWHKAISE